MIRILLVTRHMVPPHDHDVAASLQVFLPFFPEGVVFRRCCAEWCCDPYWRVVTLECLPAEVFKPWERCNWSVTSHKGCDPSFTSDPVFLTNRLVRFLGTE